MENRRISWNVTRGGKDLKLGLKYVKNLIEEYSNKKIIITADHGELLGEDGNYGHRGTRRHKHIVEVPWFEVIKK